MLNAPNNDLQVAYLKFWLTTLKIFDEQVVDK